VSRTAARLRAWTSLAAGPAAWLAHHQFGSTLNFARCEQGDSGALTIAGLAALATIALGAALAWSVWRNHAAHRDGPTSFIALLGLMAAALFGLTVAVQIGASLIVPACFH
jgi:uncharacterized membrane protein